MKKYGLMVILIMLVFLFPYCGKSGQPDGVALDKNNGQSLKKAGKGWEAWWQGEPRRQWG